MTCFCWMKGKAISGERSPDQLGSGKKNPTRFRLTASRAVEREIRCAFSAETNFDRIKKGG